MGDETRNEEKGEKTNMLSTIIKKSADFLKRKVTTTETRNKEGNDEAGMNGIQSKGKKHRNGGRKGGRGGSRRHLSRVDEDLSNKFRRRGGEGGLWERR